MSDHPRAGKLRRCKTDAEYHRLLVVLRCKVGPKKRGRQMDRRPLFLSTAKKGVPQP